MLLFVFMIDRYIMLFDEFSTTLFSNMTPKYVLRQKEIRDR